MEKIMEQFAFDNEKYKNLQKEEIYDRIKKYGKLYIEVGGKLFDDNPFYIKFTVFFNSVINFFFL